MVQPIEIPGEIPIIVLQDTVLFPQTLLPLRIFEERYRAMLDSALSGSRIFGVAQPAKFPFSLQKFGDLAEVMGIGVIRACVGRPDGTSDLVLQGLARVRIVGERSSEPFRVVQVELIQTDTENADTVAELTAQIRRESQNLHLQGYQMPEQMSTYLENLEDPEIIGDLMASTFVADPEMRQEILETSRLEARLELILDAMKAITAS